MKIKNLIAGLFLSSIMGVGVATGITLSSVSNVKEAEAAGDTPVTKIILKDNTTWCFRTLWCENFSYADGYSINELRDFMKGHYVNNVETWDPQSETIGYHEYNGNFNVCAGGSSGTYTFYFPTWLTDFSVTVENQGNSRPFEKITKLRKWYNNTTDYQETSGLGKEITLKLDWWSGVPGGDSSIGSSSTNSAWNTTVSFTTKDDLGNVISTQSLQTSKYDVLDTSASWGYTYSGLFTNAAMTTAHNSKLPLTETTIYKKLTVDKVAYASGTFNNWNASDSNYLMMPDGDQQFYIKITLAKDAEFKFVVYNEWHGWSQIDQSSKVVTNNSIIEGSDPDNTGTRIKANVAGTYEVYFKNNYGTNKIWIQQDAETEASAFATEFLTTITCTNTSTTFDISVWNNVSGTASMEYKFSQLTAGAQGKLKIADPVEGGTAIEQCAARYDRILSKYGYGTAAGQYHDFMERTPKKLNSGRVIIESTFGDNTNAIMIAVIVSVVSLSAVGGYFYLRRKREN